MNSINEDRPSRGKPRMQDIAQRAGVSVGTVSRALNGKSDVAPDLVRRVMKEARELGYELRASNPPAHTLGGELGTVGYLADIPKDSAVAFDPFQQNFISGIQQAVARANGNLLVATCRDESLEDSLPPMITKRLVSGIILKGYEQTAAVWVRKMDALLPVVTLMHNDPACGVSSVMCDNFDGIYLLLKYFRDLGHTRIGYVCESLPEIHLSIHHQQREEAFRRFAPLLGCAFRPEYVQSIVRQKPEDDVAASMETALRRFVALGTERPTAIIAAADVFAFAILHLAAKFDLRVPKDLSVAGFMNTSACEYSSPPLTSVCLSNEEIGVAAVELLQSRLQNPGAPARHVTVAPQLVERLSCGPKA